MKTESLQRQVELLSSSLKAADTTSSARAAQVDVPSWVIRATKQNALDSGANDGTAKIVAKLGRELEEKEGLLAGLRTTVRDVAGGRYPILEERNDLRAKILTLLQSQAHLLEDRETFETHNARIESQLRRTADCCQELEAYVRFLDATAVAGNEGRREGRFASASFAFLPSHGPSPACRGRQPFGCPSSVNK